ncbi:NUDIX hydrolase [Microbacterium lacticum]|uniref:NUDIX domain-containing protein n=1 Tax=Microbacterium lacticum TaxID=33885 RepID=UPI0018B08A7E|nr:NUDIX hydrolase [Microbacterium lacticum]
MSGEELWDLTDESGAPLGITHRRADPVPAGAFHVVASVCVELSGGSVLMTRRAEKKDWPLAWELPAGSALVGETSVEAASRELAEETGLRVAPEDLVLVGRVVEESALFDLYAARIADDDDLDLDPLEVCESEWVSVEELFRRAARREMAGPWADRLDELGRDLVQRIEERRIHRTR